MTRDQESGAVTRPLDLHHERYSPDGLFLRYARGQIRILWSRVAFYVVGSLILWGIVSLQAAVIALTVALLAEAIEATCLRLGYKRVSAGASGLVWRRITTGTALLHGGAVALCATTPAWGNALMGGEVNPDEIASVFTICLLVGTAINVGLVFPYHRPAAIARLTIFSLTPVVLLFVDMVDVGHQQVQLQVAGLAILYAGLGWFLIFVTRSFARTRSILLTQALQQQELEGAYERLVEQQAEAKKLALVARHANDSVILVDRNGVAQWVNEAFTRITGHSFGETVGRNLGTLLNHPDTDPAAIQLIEDCRTAARPIRVQVLNLHKEGHGIWIETNQVPIQNHQGEVTSYIAIERDITATKQNAQKLDDARRAAEEGARAKSDFLATMSHEIRTPMNGVIGMAQLLEETDLDEDQKLYSDTILSSARTLLALINDILDLSKLEAGQITLSPTNFDLQACFDETVRLLRSQAEIKGLELIVEQDADLPRSLHGDDHRLRQILINLVGNAIKFTEKGRVKVSVEVEPTKDAGVLLHCAVSDTGIGIPKDMLTRIFERFSQADAAISRRFGGSGLGLAISRRLAEAMGGRIAVSSEIGAGSCFTLVLPFDAATDSVEAALSLAPEAGSREDELAGLRLLVAEDNRVNRLLIQKFLKDADLELEFAHDGAEAVDKAEHFKPDIILMDVSMPVMDGLEATQIIRSWPQPQPVIIALTANAFDTDRKACLAVGMDEFVTKPVNRRQLQDVLATYWSDKARRPRAG
jgi:PAS domain S-box-containing protein